MVDGRIFGNYSGIPRDVGCHHTFLTRSTMTPRSDSDILLQEGLLVIYEKNDVGCFSDSMYFLWWMEGYSVSYGGIRDVCRHHTFLTRSTMTPPSDSDILLQEGLVVIYENDNVGYFIDGM